VNNSSPDFLTREFWQGTSDTKISLHEQKMSSSKPKKDKGKAIQKDEDYQLQVPVQNQFTPLTFLPLPYKLALIPEGEGSETQLILLNKENSL